MSTTKSPRTEELAPVIPLTAAASAASPRRRTTPLSAAALLVATALALSPLWTGFYDFGAWGPLSLGAIVLLVILALMARPTLTRAGLTASAGIGLLLSISAASMLWAESKESAWTDSNRLALYCVIFAVGVLAIRERRSARSVMLILGAPALLTGILLSISFIAAGGQGAFLDRRLNSPIGYINGTAGLLAMGVWPWVGFAEATSRRVAAAASLAAATLIASTAVMTQSRAIIPATVVALILVLAAAPGRTRRAVNLIIGLGCTAIALPWTLAVYAHGGAAERSLPPTDGVLRGAGFAILGSAVCAGLLYLLVGALSDRMPAARRPAAVRSLGRGLLGVTVLAAVVGVILGGGTIRTQWNAFTNLKVNESASSRFLDAGGFRYDLWRVAVREFRDNPIGGVGAGNYDVDYYRLRDNPQYVVQPHSLELQMAAELGLVGEIGLLVFLIGVIWAACAKRGTLAAEDRVIKVAALGMFASWLAATSVDWLYDIPGLAGSAFLCAALLIATPSRSRTALVGQGTRGVPAGPRTRAAQVVLVCGLGALALMAASIGRQYAGSRYSRTGTSQVTSSPRTAIDTLEQAASLDPFSLTTLYSIASAYARLDDYADARAALLEGQRREPHNYVPPALLGDLATRKGDTRTALAAYTRALGLNPRDPGLYADVTRDRKLAR